MQIANSSWQESVPPGAARRSAADGLAPPALAPLSIWRLALTLFKLRVVSLLLLAAFGGAFLGMLTAGRASWLSLLLLAVTGTLSAGGASAINQYLERKRDTHMYRTAARPLPTGRINNPRRVLWLGLGMVLGSSGLAAIFNLPLAFWLLTGAVVYVGVYTIWLKPRTTLNIVIGGAAGSCAVISGGAAVGDWSALGVWLLAALVFVWTPVHFWSLALAYREDYIRADYPMLPARVSPLIAARWTAFHTALTVILGLAVGLWPKADPIYLIIIGLATAALILRTRAMLNNPEKGPALALFHYSNLYLTLVLVVIMLASLWR